MRIFVYAAVFIALAGPALAETLVQRDALGRRTGTIEPDGPNRMVVRDALGRRIGTQERR